VKINQLSGPLLETESADLQACQAERRA